MMKRLYMGKHTDGRWTVIMFALFAIVMVSDQFKVIFDEYFAPRPFVQTNRIEVLAPFASGGQPRILYDATARQYVDATWIAIIKDTNETRIAMRRGTGAYSTQDRPARIWSWRAFFDNERGSPIPAVPAVPFRVCVRYVSTALDSGVVDQSPVVCSKPYAPGGAS